jgi:SAM-dependent methyltransferase
MSKSSTEYQDYVFKDGKLLGRFNDMYRYSREVPWHQDKTAQQIFVDLDLAILKHFLPPSGIREVCDLGCGLGYVSSRLHAELSPLFPGLAVTGLDISTEATRRAQELFPHLSFAGIDLLSDDLNSWRGRFHLIYMKDVIWYICDDVERFFDNVRQMLRKGGAIYVMQSVPDSPSFIGSDKFPSTFAIGDFLSARFEPIYVSSTFEMNSGRVVGHSVTDKYLRFLGRT